MILVVIGGLNMGLIGFFSYDLIGELLGAYPLVVTIIYDVVGVAAVVVFITSIMHNCCSSCKKE